VVWCALGIETDKGGVLKVIEVFTGGVGSGKSYHALSKGLAWVECRLRFRRYVVANFPVIRQNERWIYIPNEQLKPLELVRMSFERGWYGNESQCLLIIDEASVLFNARDWQLKGKERLDWIKFFAQSRKLGYDIVLISQDIRSLDRQVRSLADVEVKHLAFSRLPYLSWIPRILRLQISFAVSYALRTSFNGIPTVFAVWPWVAKRYDTMRLFDITYLSLAAEQSGSQDAGVGGPPRLAAS